MKEYGSDWGGHDYKEDKDENEIKKEIDEKTDIDKENKLDNGPFECPDYNNRDPNYNPFECLGS